MFSLRTKKHFQASHVQFFRITVNPSLFTLSPSGILLAHHAPSLCFLLFNFLDIACFLANRSCNLKFLWLLIFFFCLYIWANFFDLLKSTSISLFHFYLCKSSISLSNLISHSVLLILFLILHFVIAVFLRLSFILSSIYPKLTKTMQIC